MQEWVPIVTALLSIAGALVSIWFSTRAARGERLAAAEELASRFREPLLQAAFNLETRIYNMVELGFLSEFLGPDSTEDEREYAVLNTLYVFGQYFCWVEILRREAQFLDPRDVERNRQVAGTLEAVRDTFSDSRRIPGRAFRVFRGEQRALGEVMLVPASGSDRGAPRWDCAGYASFVQALDEPRTARWFDRLRDDVVTSVAAPDGWDARLRLVQRDLIDIINALDPEARRVPVELRQRAKLPASPPRGE